MCPPLSHIELFVVVFCSESGVSRAFSVDVSRLFLLALLGWGSGARDCAIRSRCRPASLFTLRFFARSSRLSSVSTWGLNRRRVVSIWFRLLSRSVLTIVSNAASQDTEAEQKKFFFSCAVMFNAHYCLIHSQSVQYASSPHVPEFGERICES